MSSAPLRRFGVMLTLLACATASIAYEPVFHPRLQADRADGEITIDGVLDDPGWRSAGRADGFVERHPGENLEPQVRTEAWITYDDHNLYVAFVCWDDPEALRTTMCQRDHFNGDDSVGVLFDTYGEGVWAYEFWVNPYGIQKDEMWTAVHGEDRGFDLVWTSAAKIGEDRWTAEMAIPFAALRFPDREEQQWRMDFWRAHPRETYRQYSWAALDPEESCFPCMWGTVDGIRGVKPGKGFELLPSFVGYRTGAIADALDPDSGIDDADPEGEFSLGAKYSPTSDITLEASVNPDFSQIEADADQIDVNTTIQLRFPERRPFFNEGNDLYRTMFNSFYTRMVADPQFAAKGTARWDRTSVFAMTARDEHSPYIIPLEESSRLVTHGRSTVNVLRGLQSLGNGSQAGAMVTDRRYDDGGHGTILSGDARIRLTSSISWMGQFVHSRTTEPDGVAISEGATFDDGRHTVDLDGESFTGDAFITELRRHGRTWNVVLDYNQVAADYRTQTGYDPWNNQRNGFIWANYHFFTDGGLVERVTPGLFADGRWTMDGKRKWRHVNTSLDFRLRKAQTFFSLGYRAGEETWGGIDYDDLWSVSANLHTRPADAFGFGAYVRYGEAPAIITDARGDELRVGLSCDLKPLDRLTIEPTYDYIRSEDHATGDLLFRQAIIRARVRLQVDRRLSLRLVVQHNDSTSPVYLAYAESGDFPSYHMSFGSKWEVDPLITYRLNSFSMFYLGSTHDWRDFNAANESLGGLHRMTARQYFVKLQYLLQV